MEGAAGYFGKDPHQNPKARSALVWKTIFLSSELQAHGLGHHGGGSSFRTVHRATGCPQKVAPGFTMY
jgi:hypothetical protein